MSGSRISRTAAYTPDAENGNGELIPPRTWREEPREVHRELPSPATVTAAAMTTGVGSTLSWSMCVRKR